MIKKIRNDKNAKPNKPEKHQKREDFGQKVPNGSQKDHFIQKARESNQKTIDFYD